MEFLYNLVDDENEQVVVRHEAAEGLGNYTPSKKTTALLKKHCDSKYEEVRDTCILAYHKHITYL